MTTTTIKQYDIFEMAQINKAKGQFWFDKDSMAFFKTKIAVHPNRHNLFITSEINPSKEKAYTVRLFTENGKVHTLGAFHAHTLHTAKRAVEHISLALDQAGNREIDILKNMTWAEQEDNVLKLLADDKGFHINMDYKADKSRLICG